MSAPSPSLQETKVKVFSDFWRLAAPKGSCKLLDLEPSLPSEWDKPSSSEGGCIAREAFLEWLFVCAPASSALFTEALTARCSLLQAAAELVSKPSAQDAWPPGAALPTLVESGSEDAELWEKRLLIYGAAPLPAAAAEMHFRQVLRHGLDANNVPFPRIESSRRCSKLARLGSPRPQAVQPNTLPFLMPHTFVSEGAATRAPPEAAQAGSGEAEAMEKWIEAFARAPTDLRAAVYALESEPVAGSEMPVLPVWRVLPDAGVIVADTCTEEQQRIADERQQRNFTEEKALRNMRMRKGWAWLKEVSFPRGHLPHAPGDLLPELDKEAALVEMRVRWARDKDQAAKEHDERAELGATFTAWPEPGSRKWPVDPKWVSFAKWFKRWRARSSAVPAAQATGAPAPTPLRRSESTSSIKSWLSVSDISWVEVESRAEQEGWDMVIQEEAAALAEVRAAAGSIKSSDLLEMKDTVNPAESVRLVLEVVCIMLGMTAEKDADGNLDYFELAKAELLGKDDFMSRLLAVEADLPRQRFEALEPYIACEDFVPEKVKDASVACEALCSWVRAIYKYHSMTHAKAAPEELIRLLREAEETLDVLCKADIGELKALAKPPAGIDTVLLCVMHLLAGVSPSIAVVKKGGVCYPRDRTWKGCQAMLGDTTFLQQLLDFKAVIGERRVPRQNVQRARKLKDAIGPDFSFEAMKKKSMAAAGLCVWVLNIMMYYDIAMKYLGATSPEPAASSEASAAQVAEPAGRSQASIDAGCLREVKSLASPPQAVMIVCMCVMVLRPRGREEAEAAGWAGCKKMFADASLGAAMKAYKPEDATEAQRAKVRSLMDEHAETFSGCNLMKVSLAAHHLFQWVRRMVDPENGN